MWFREQANRTNEIEGSSVKWPCLQLDSWGEDLLLWSWHVWYFLAKDKELPPWLANNGQDAWSAWIILSPLRLATFFWMDFLKYFGHFFTCYTSERCLVEPSSESKAIFREEPRRFPLFSSCYSDLVTVNGAEGSRGMVVSNLWLPKRTMILWHRGIIDTSSNPFEYWQHLWPFGANNNLIFSIACRGLCHWRHKKYHDALALR